MPRALKSRTAILWALFSLCVSLPAYAARPTVVYLTDVEGHWSRVDDFLKDNPAFYQDDQQSWHIRKGYIFVYGGDSIDKGSKNKGFLKFLTSLKDRYPAQVEMIGGNRDTNKINLAEKMAAGFPGDSSGQKRAPDRVVSRVKWILSNVFGVPGLFESWRDELLQERKVATLSDHQVADDLIHELSPDGAMGKYLTESKIIHRVGDTLFVHGAVLEQNLFRIPGTPPRIAKSLDDWIEGLNSWYHSQIQAWVDWIPKSDDPFPASELSDYLQAHPGTWANFESVIYGRFADENGLSTLSPKVEETLARSGIRRVVVGHTPAGHSPAILRGDKVEVVIADNSTEVHGTLVVLNSEMTRIRSKVQLSPQGPFVPLDFEWTVGDPHSPIGKRLAQNPTGGPDLITGRLTNGDLVLFEMVKDPGDRHYRSVYKQISAQDPNLSLLKAPYPERLPDGHLEIPRTYFDWDENIINSVQGLPPRIYLYNKLDDTELGVSPADFALIQQELGEPGKWKNYELRREGAHGGSFRETRDAHGVMTFREQLEKILGRPESEWQGPSFAALQKALSDPKTAALSGIITGREHSPEGIYEGLKLLQERGYIRYLPPISSIWPVGNPRYAELGESIAARKAKVMSGILNHLQANIASTEKASPGAQVVWEYSDDDWKNIDKAREALIEAIHENNWPNIRVRLRFTGLNDPKHAPALLELTLAQDCAQRVREELNRLLQGQAKTSVRP